MPRRPPKPCAQPGCPRLTNEAYCQEHKPDRAPDDRPSAAARGYDGRWRKVRRIVLAEEPLCRSCKARGRVVLASEVDHIMPLSDGGTEERENLQSLCKPCHSEKTGRERMGNG